MASRTQDVADSGSGFRGSVSPQLFWQIITAESKPLLDLYNASANKDELKAKFDEVDEDFSASFFDDGDVDCAESAWNALDGKCQTKIINLLEEGNPEIKAWLEQKKGEISPEDKK